MALAWLQWRPELNFIRLHYAWIIFCSLLAFPILYPYGNLTGIDTLFFGCSASTESGLNTVDVNQLKTYQQVYLYIIPAITNLMFINAFVVVVRLFWFRKRLRGAAQIISSEYLRRDDEAIANKTSIKPNADTEDGNNTAPQVAEVTSDMLLQRSTTVSFGQDTKTSRSHDNHHHSPGKHRGRSTTEEMHELEDVRRKSIRTNNGHENQHDDKDTITPLKRSRTEGSQQRTGLSSGPTRIAARSLERAATSAFVLGAPGLPRVQSRSKSQSRPAQVTTMSLPQLSRQVTIGRNSNFYNLTEEDRERLGGIEYRALRLLLKFVFGYFFGLHLLGVICLLPWIHKASPKYTGWLEESGVGSSWWAFYSAQTMTNNLGFTLTPDSMVTFKDATWPMLVMTFLAFAGNTCYPVFLRLLVWTSSKMVPKHSRTRETMQFLLDHPRRCYTLLFPSHPTWILFGIVFLLNFVDVVLIITLDLDNPAVADLPVGPRILSALFQAASARHTGTATLNLAQVNPAVQFSLLTMMYIAVFPIAISIRASNTDEDKTLGIWSSESQPDERNGLSYIMVHIRNQFTFDLWYIFLGTFLISILEADRIADVNEPSFSLFSVLFEVTSAYGNVGLSLGGPFGSTSMAGHYATFSKFVVCAMMIRGRHRVLPYALDRAINLPVDEAKIESTMADKAVDIDDTREQAVSR